jgi:anaerobic magnesium-protoporphyrin IX monomethyl ester cyclase
MKIVLINPGAPFLIRQDVMPPLGLWYIGKALKQGGHEVEYVDIGLGDAIPKGADVYGVTGTSAQIEQIVTVGWLLKQEHGRKIVGGPHATLRPYEFLNHGFDTVVQHEGEEEVCGIVRDGAVGVVSAKRIKNIDGLFPDRTQEHRYSYKIDGLPATTMLTSRGCPYACAFCSKDVWGRMYIARSVTSTLQEVDEVMAAGYKAIMFYDDTLMVGRERLRELCAGLRERGVIWRGFARSDQVTDTNLQMMYDAGCREIGVGVESGSPQILLNINKGDTVEDHRRCIALAHKVGLRVKAFIIVGLPGETQETIAETDLFLEETRPDDVDISILTVYPGSAIYANPHDYDLVFGASSYYKGKPGEYVCNVSTSGMSQASILEARERLHQKHKR